MFKAGDFVKVSPAARAGRAVRANLRGKPATLVELLPDGEARIRLVSGGRPQRVPLAALRKIDPLTAMGGIRLT